MAGGLQIPGGGGKRKSLDFTLNLVPFIDLLSCCISFLLITAVWTQLTSLHVEQKEQGVIGEGDALVPQWHLRVFIDDRGFRVDEGGEVTSIPNSQGQYEIVQLTRKLA